MFFHSSAMTATFSLLKIAMSFFNPYLLRAIVIALHFCAVLGPFKAAC